MLLVAFISVVVKFLKFLLGFLGDDDLQKKKLVLFVDSLEQIVIFHNVKELNRKSYVISHDLKLHGHSFFVRFDPGTRDKGLSCELVYLGNSSVTISCKMTIMSIQGTEYAEITTSKHVTLTKEASSTKHSNLWHCLSKNVFKELYVDDFVRNALHLKVQITLHGQNLIEPKVTTTRSLHYYQLTKNRRFKNDCHIYLKDKSKIDVNKNILCSNSKVFKTMLSSGWSESTTNTIRILDFSADTVRLFIKLLYAYKCSLSSHLDDKIIELLKISHKYDVINIFNTCQIELARRLTVETAVTVLVFADTYQATYLKGVAADMILQESIRTQNVL
jgi:hypothetical protein